MCIFSTRGESEKHKKVKKKNTHINKLLSRISHKYSPSSPLPSVMEHIDLPFRSNKVESKCPRRESQQEREWHRTGTGHHN